MGSLLILDIAVGLHVDPAGMVRHGDDYVAAVGLEGKPGDVFRLIAAIVVAGSILDLFPMKGRHVRVETASAEHFFMGVVAHGPVAELIVRDYVPAENKLLGVYGV